MAKPSINDGLEILKLQNKVTALEGQIRTLQNMRTGEKHPQEMGDKIDNLRSALQALKMKLSMGRHDTDDKFRLAALEAELGRWLLMMDGVL